MSDKTSLREKIQTTLRLDRAVRLVWEITPGWTLTNLLLLVVQALLPLASLYLMKRIVDGVAAGLSAPDRVAAFKPVLGWLLLAGGAAVLSVLARSLAELATESQSQVVTDSVSDILHAQSVAVDLEYYEDPSYYDTLHRAQHEAPYRPTRIVNGLVQLAQNGISLVGIAGLLLAVNWWVMLVLFLAALPAALVRFVFARKRYAFEQEKTQAERRAWYYHWMLTDSGHAKELRLFGLGSLFQERYRSLRRKLREGRLALTRRRLLADLIVQGLSSAAIFGSFGLIAYQTVAGAVTLGGLVMYYQSFQSGLGFLRAILGGVAGLYEDNLFLDNFYRFLDLKPTIKTPSDPRPVPTKIEQGIVFKNVSFSYSGGGHEALKGIDLNLAPGEVIALVGANGSGKTTLIKLLCRLYDPNAGAITLDGTDLREMDPICWRREISVIFQDYIHYHLSVRENIWLSDVDLDPQSQLITEAANLSGADPVIQRLPQGYETILGHWFENGQELSIGEWQKVALARAFLRNARVIVLDEPTSSLDPLAEAEVFRHFRELVAGHSAILISHRFSTVQMADRIYVLDRGAIVEQGTHHELLQQNGRYARLYHVQAEHYQQDTSPAHPMQLTEITDR